MKKGIVNKAWEVQTALEKKVERFGKGKYGRVFKMARNPEPDEYIRTSEICAVGISIIGLIGFIIFLFATEVAPWIASQLGI